MLSQRNQALENRQPTDTTPASRPDSGSKKPRKIGLDLVRITATVAVVLLHSGGIDKAGFNPGATALRSYFTFPVPVFLALSLYLSAMTIAKRGHLKLGAKLSRLLWPYVFFASFYLLFNALQGSGLSLGPYINRLQTLLLSDPAGVMFLGQAAVLLYFLPLLAMGTLGMQVLSRWLGPNRDRIRLMAGATILSAIAYQLMTVSGNAFTLGPPHNIAFQALIPTLQEQPLLRVGLTYLAWLLWCLPYIFGAFCLAAAHPQLLGQPPANPSPTSNKLDTDKTSQPPRPILSFAMMAAMALVFSLQPLLQGLDVLRDIAIAFLAVTCGLMFSQPLTQQLGRYQRVIKAVSHYSFGIYLVHPVALYITGKMLSATVSATAFQADAPVSVLRVLIYLVIGLGLSLMAIAALDKTIPWPPLRKCLGL